MGHVNTDILTFNKKKCIVFFHHNMNVYFSTRHGSMNCSEATLTAECAHYLLMLHLSGSTLVIYPSKVMEVEEP